MSKIQGVPWIRGAHYLARDVELALRRLGIISP
jgi:hypothetical protein